MANQVGHRRFQEFPADAFGGFPDYGHCLSEGLIVGAPASWETPRILVRLPDQPDAALAMVSGDQTRDAEHHL